MSDEKSWAVQWLMSRQPNSEHNAVLTMATIELDAIQNQHDLRREALANQLAQRLDQINKTDYSVGNKSTAVQDQLRTADRESAQKSHDDAIARLDMRSGTVQDVQRIIARR